MLATFNEYHRSFLTLSAQISYKTNTVGRSVYTQTKTNCIYQKRQKQRQSRKNIRKTQ